VRYKKLIATIALKSYRQTGTRSDNIAWESRRSSVNTLKLINLKQPKISIRTRLIAAGTCFTFFAECAQIAVVSESGPPHCRSISL
jgi:16S rRNA C1402 (ribose-2'-O) methylase RsmI